MEQGRGRGRGGEGRGGQRGGQRGEKHRPVIFRANFADVSKGTDCAFGICISRQCEGDDDDWIEIFSCSAFLEGCSNGPLCTMQSCGCPLLALASLREVEVHLGRLCRNDLEVRILFRLLVEKDLAPIRLVDDD